MIVKTALICGVNGQDGAYLSRFLLSKGYNVWGTSRDAFRNTFDNLRMVGVYKSVNVVSMDVEDFASTLSVIKKAAPDEIYYLAGQSSVALSFEQPAETIKSVVLGVLNLLESCRLSNKKIRLYCAGSSECFGDTAGSPANELTPFNPRSPYAMAKASAYWLVNNYREAYNLYACTGILFNHESTLRPARFVIQKIVRAAQEISNGSYEKLALGNVNIERDWGWAPEYVEAMWLMLQNDIAEDFVIATGKSHKLIDVISHTFNSVGLDWNDHVVINDRHYRPTDILVSKADPSSASKKLGWCANTNIFEIVEKMLGTIV